MGELLYNSNHNTVRLILFQERTVKVKSELISWNNVEIKTVNKANKQKKTTNNKKRNSPNSKMPTTSLGAAKYCLKSRVKYVPQLKKK